MKEVIRFEDFSWKYDAQQEPTLHGLNLSIHEGEKVLICGPSGCGKSTIANCINGLIPFSYRGESHGSIKILGKETKDLSLFDISKMVGTVLQDTDGQFVGLTVGEDIAFALENDCVPQTELLRRVKETADMVSIGTHLKYSPSEISGGQKQRVSLAGVLVDNVPILLFDEPLANLDPATGKTTMELIDEIHKKTNATIVIIEHRVEDVLHRYVDRIVVMSEGRIEMDASPDDILSGDALKEKGIREPLYITALKYAGVDIKPEMKPASIRDITLSGDDKEKVRSWYSKGVRHEKEKCSEVILEASHVSFAYPGRRKTTKDVSFSVHKGEMLSIVGTNGAGKSTLAKLICGFVNPLEGSFKLGNTDLCKLSIKEIADHVGYVMQNPNQMISKPMIRDEVALGLKLRGVSEEEQKRRTDEVLKICGLYPFRNWPVSALSYGQKKRVTIASILVLNPEIIILDEPTAGQDFRHYTEIMEFLKKINLESGVTVIMITHDMHLMLEYCDRSVVLSDGEIIADMAPEEVLTNPSIIERASLKETSLYGLANLAGINEQAAFCRHFIDFERNEVRTDG
ncbi:MAG: ABC transporter ATP-binding protein [Eubacteriales bacterium]|nr:ABC transporter ATP-binding protein [Eubacteriales bacterium]